MSRADHFQGWKSCFLLGVMSLCVISLAAGPKRPDAPAASAFAPAKLLEAEADQLLASIEKVLAEEASYQELTGQLTRDANTLAAISVALGLHDQDNRLKKSAGAVLSAAVKLAEAEDYAAAREAHAVLKQAATGAVDAPLAAGWQTVGSLDQLMKQSTLLYNKLKRGTAGARFKQRAEENARAAAVLAVIGQIALCDTDYVEGDEQLAQWYAFCAQWRDAAGELGAAIRDGNEEAALAALAKLDNSCTQCHEALKLEIK